MTQLVVRDVMLEAVPQCARCHHEPAPDKTWMGIRLGPVCLLMAKARRRGR